MPKRRGNSEGTITKRGDGRWEARVSLPDGKRKSFYGETQAEVRRKLDEARRTLEQGLPLATGSQSTQQYFQSWLEAVKHQVKESTWRRYKDYVNLYVVPAFGAVGLSKITPHMLQTLYTKKMNEGFSSTTIHSLHLVIHHALKDAVRLGEVARNVSEMVQPPRKRHTEMQVLSEEQARLVLAFAKGQRLEALYTLALSTGMRRGELLALQWQDVVVDKSVLHVRFSLQQLLNGKVVLSETKTAKSRRQVALSQTAVLALRSHRVRQLEERLSIGDLWSSEYDLVFPNTIGKILDPASLLTDFGRLLVRASLPHIRFHDLRHTAATLLLSWGINPKVVSEMLGHSSVAITLGVYSHVTPHMQQLAADVMDKVFS